VQGKSTTIGTGPTATDRGTQGHTSTATRIDAHVLVADANAESRAAREADLRTRGFRVSVARTGFEAIVKACCHLPDLILLDPSLGELDAVTTMQLLTTCPATSHIPVVRLTEGRRVPTRALSQLQRASM
jgi:CheY-like chemotaxis protein